MNLIIIIKIFMISLEGSNILFLFYLDCVMVLFEVLLGGDFMLELVHIYLSLNQNNRPLIKDLSFVLSSNDKVAIIGEEGNGKSTLLKFIYDSSLVEGYCTCAGEVISHNYKIGYLEQFLDSRWNHDSVFNYFLKSSPEAEIDYEKYNLFGDLLKIIVKMGFNEDILEENYMISYLSGGEKVKLQLCKLLLEKNDILLLDEPTNDLDIETLRWLEDFIINSKQPIIFVSHDETLLENTANTIIHLEQLKKKSDSSYTIAKIGYKEYVRTRLRKIENQNQQAAGELRNYKAEVQTLKQIKSKVQFANPGRTNRMNSLLAQEKKLEERTLTHKADVEEAIHIQFHPDISIPNGKMVLDLELDDLKVGDRVLAKDISLSVQGPEHIVIVGQNGAGKTMLVKSIYEVLKIRDDIRLGYMPQNYEDLLNSNQKAIDFLKTESFSESYIRSFMGNMKFTRDEMLSFIKELSGGQKAKLLLMKMILDDCNVLLLDEPTRNLSPLSNPIIRDVLTNYHGTIISVSHDRKYIKEVCQKAYWFDEGGLRQISIEDAVAGKRP